VYNSDLATDLAAYPEREHKNVGLNGTNLSGGQRQRLAICRALYMNAEKYLLDDILSSVDEHVADLIMQRAICH
jgi:ABC-type multidrug transport system fused ATPase/permease subunit